MGRVRMPRRFFHPVFHAGHAPLGAALAVYSAALYTGQHVVGAFAFATAATAWWALGTEP